MLSAARSSIPRALLFLSVLVVAGCATTGSGEQGDREEIVIEIRNDNFNQATVFIPGGRRIGIVGGKSEATFRVVWHLPEVELSVRLLTGGSIRLLPRSASSGEVWEFIIPANCC